MAIFKSTLLSDVRGSLNGSTFSRTRAGNILRNRTQPVQPNTPFQTEQRAFMQQAADLYRDLTGPEIDAWNGAIALSGFTMQNALGDSYTPSAKQVFTMISLNLSKLNGAPTPADLTKFIADSNLPGLAFTAVEIDIMTGTPPTLDRLQISGAAGTVAGQVQIAATLPISPTIANYKKYLRTLGYKPITTAPTTINFADLYEARFTGLNWDDALGSKINVAARVVNETTGLAGAWLYLGGVIVPAP